jgi:hypothetical protein
MTGAGAVLEALREREDGTMLVRVLSNEVIEHHCADGCCTDRFVRHGYDSYRVRDGEREDSLFRTEKTRIVREIEQ